MRHFCEWRLMSAAFLGAGRRCRRAAGRRQRQRQRQLGLRVRHAARQRLPAVAAVEEGVAAAGLAHAPAAGPRAHRAEAEGVRRYTHSYSLTLNFSCSCLMDDEFEYSDETETLVHYKSLTFSYLPRTFKRLKAFK